MSFIEMYFLLCPLLEVPLYNVQMKLLELLECCDNIVSRILLVALYRIM